MKNLFPGILLVFFATNSYSQSVRNRQLTLTLGPSFPTGKFSSNDITNDESGLANTGQSVNISWTRFFGDKFGIIMMAQGQRNPLKVNSMEGSFSELPFYNGVWASGTILPPQPSPGPGTIYPNWKFDNKSWYTASLFLGGNVQLPINQLGNTFFTSRALIGVVHAWAPVINGTSRTDTSSAHYHQNGTTGFGMTYLFGAGMKFNVGEKLFLLAGLDYTGTNKIRFNYTKVTLTTTRGTPFMLDYSISQSTASGKVELSITALNASIGVGIRL